MNPIEKIHTDWLPVINLLYQEPLVSLNENILPNISFQPKKENIFNVFQTPIKNIKVVILGQDPYPTPGDAIGRAFAVSENTKIPVSLRNIKQEIFNENRENFPYSDCVLMEQMDNKFNPDNWKTLEHWQEQGVFLLNTALTVETGKAGSHLKYWQEFTKRVISHISSTQPCIWLLWGKKAQEFIPYIKNPYIVKGYDNETIQNIPSNEDWNYILTAPHPAAEAYSGGKAGFFGCNHFMYTNRVLQNLKKAPIYW